MFDKVLIFDDFPIFCKGIVLSIEKYIEDIEIINVDNIENILEENTRYLIFIKAEYFNLNSEYLEEYKNDNIKLVLIHESLASYYPIENSDLVIGELSRKIEEEELKILLERVLELKFYREENIERLRKDKYLDKENLLTSRELNLIEYILKGKSNREIATKMYLSEKTIKNNITLLYKKLGVKNRKEVFTKYK